MLPIKRAISTLLPLSYRFTRVYNRGGWTSTESVSGPGSTLASTEEIRSRLPEVFAELGVHSMLDAPCGDFHWMKEVLGMLPDDFVYFGADIVAPLVKSLRDHESHKVHFMVADIRKDELPQSDLILCRDCFIHLSVPDTRRALDNFRRSGARYLLTTSFTEIEQNDDMRSGSYRPVNLERDPFWFPAPLVRISEGYRGGKCLGLWSMDDLPN
jgi:hypothetical protein